jgi:uncharacterized protein
VASGIVHFEINGKDSKKTVKFYKSLLGWKPKRMGKMDYHIVGADGPKSIGGGLSTAPKGKKANIAIYAVVPSLEKTLKKAVKLGAKVTQKPTQVPNGPRIAMIKDPDGLAFGFVEAGGGM